MNRFVCVATMVGFAAGVVVAPPAQAKRPDPPQVTALSSVTMPSYACQSAGKWVHVTYFPGTRVDSSWVTSVRKQGFTFPVSDYKVCGYMGSGTYTVKTKVRWSVAKWGWKRVPVYRYKDVQKPTGEYTPPVWADKAYPFTCAINGPATQNSEYRGGVLAAFYNCVSDDGSDISFAEDSTVNLPSSDWTFTDLDYYSGQLILSPTRNNIPFSEVPATVTGTATQTVQVGGDEPIYETVSKRYVHHYRKKRVTRWVKQPALTVNRVVQVTVR